MKTLLVIFLIIFFVFPISPKIRKLQNKNHVKYMKFISGLAIGYGLNTDATEELKDCFIKKKDHNDIVRKFFQNTKTFSSKNRKNENELKNSTLSTESGKMKSQQKATSFTKASLNFFAKLKDCAPFKESFFTFLKNRLFNIGVKGIAYAVGGVIGLLIKSSYDLYKLITEIKDFYHTSRKLPVDYFKMGSSVGKIIYYTQNLIFRRRK
jgi:hypothetical protein